MTPLKDTHFTPTQQRIIDLLRDGNAHPRKDLLACLDDELANRQALNAHLCRIRKLLRNKGQRINCEMENMRICYRHVILLTSVTQ